MMNPLPKQCSKCGILIDPEDIDLIANKPWRQDEQGYWKYCFRKTFKLVHVYLHILVLERKCGPRPRGKIADHKNRDRADNRRDNLRWATVTESNRNRVLPKSYARSN